MFELLPELIFRIVVIAVAFGGLFFLPYVIYGFFAAIVQFDHYLLRGNVVVAVLCALGTAMTVGLLYVFFESWALVLSWS